MMWELITYAVSLAFVFGVLFGIGTLAERRRKKVWDEFEERPHHWGCGTEIQCESCECPDCKDEHPLAAWDCICDCEDCSLLP